jgi:hypothetical protein
MSETADNNCQFCGSTHGDTHSLNCGRPRNQRIAGKRVKTRLTALGQMRQVDEVLTVNWIEVKGGDYRQALHDLITRAVAIENDPEVSEAAKARADRMAALETAVRDALDYMNKIPEVIPPYLRRQLERAL